MELNSETIKELEDRGNGDEVDIRRLRFPDKQIARLEVQIFDKFQMLKRLYLQGNKITVLPKNIFCNLTRLRLIHLGDNKLTKLDDGIFQHNRKLKRIVLSDNEISEIEEAVFANLTNLRGLYLSGNQLTSFNLKDLKDSHKLSILELHNNKLRTLNGYQSPLLILPELRECTIDGNDFNSLYWVWIFETFEKLMIKCCDFNPSECLIPDAATRIYQFAMNTRLTRAMPLEPEWMQFKERRQFSSGSSSKNIKSRKTS